MPDELLARGLGASSPVQGRVSVLVVAGEASGDRLAGDILRHLPDRASGMGGAACAAAGAELLVDLRGVTAAGLGDGISRLPSLLRAFRVLLIYAAEARPRTALLVNFTEFNALLGRALRKLRVDVTWCVAPQIWAWRRGRGRRLARSMDRLAVLFPFEEALWRGYGVPTTWVGHPLADQSFASRDSVRLALGLERPCVALLPGSRPAEVRRLLPPFLAAARLLERDGVDARLLVASSLDAAAARGAVALADSVGVASVRVDERGLAPHLRGFDAALVAAGTASLEAVLAGVPPVIAYRVDPISAVVARRLIRVPHVGLPNILAGERVFPELLQGDLTPEALAREARCMLSEARREDAIERIRAQIAPDDGTTFGERAARLVARRP